MANACATLLSPDVVWLVLEWFGPDDDWRELAMTLALVLHRNGMPSVPKPLPAKGVWELLESGHHSYAARWYEQEVSARKRWIILYRLGLSARERLVNLSAEHGHLSTLLRYRTNEDPNTMISIAAQGGHEDIVRQCKEWGACDYDGAICWAAEGGHLVLVHLFKEWGARNYDDVMCWAAQKGRLDLVRQCHEWGASGYNNAMCWAAYGGHLDIVRQCHEWGARNYNQPMLRAAQKGHLDIVRQCHEWGARNYDWAIGNACGHEGTTQFLKTARNWQRMLRPF